MTSPVVARALLAELDFVADDAPVVVPSRPFAFVVDFDSSLAFTDLSFDPASPEARYADADRPGIRRILDDARDLLATRAPRAFALVDRQLGRTMLRRSDALPAAASASNRNHVGVCVLTNVHVPPDPLLVCVEALVHESVHQYLYRVEREHGDFCDLGAPGRHRSPWSGNRIPLHSLVHASFVYFALLGLWCRLARRADDARQAALVRDRMARNLFGYRYLRTLLDGPAFPRRLVQPTILAAIDRMVASTRAAELPSDRQRRLSESLRSCDDDAWLDRLAAGLGEVVRPAASVSLDG